MQEEDKRKGRMFCVPALNCIARSRNSRKGLSVLLNFCLPPVSCTAPVTLRLCLHGKILHELFHVQTWNRLRNQAARPPSGAGSLTTPLLRQSRPRPPRLYKMEPSQLPPLFRFFFSEWKVPRRRRRPVVMATQKGASTRLSRAWRRAIGGRRRNGCCSSASRALWRGRGRLQGWNEARRLARGRAGWRAMRIANSSGSCVSNSRAVEAYSPA